ncbi:MULTISPECIES: response regulator transcription factor [unclassified Bosea (in: a-proteobacteria)]|uniref:response regulator n=1 Tax=unclassified Bosea (in: a-proteobacteria) TaxID=2653178 RepID=UPI000F75FC0B|nr:MULTISPECIES: response regulator transcription factor [unclassified Bosea (in: a-proteobacteria)]AZO81842.1 DNA-binding response regulator [Bosea sp. Tri-49]RXT24930.1 DNA-binding response regulator [Bosea sp. Tri-39]RXT33482.1 DNA-binding response regulator [Bosea sp. Tri-54]
MRKISIAVVDDHPLLMEGLVALMQRKVGFSLSAAGSDAGDIYSITEKHRPDAMIVDLNMPGDAFRAIKDATKTAPDMKIVVFTASTNTDHAIQALEAGAKGYVLKGSSADELIKAIEATCRGEIYITPCFAAKVISALQGKALDGQAAQSAKLSVREDQIIRLLLCGKQNREIARALSLSEKTVKGYMTLLMQKLKARNRLEVVIAAQRLNPAAFEGMRISPRPQKSI